MEDQFLIEQTLNGNKNAFRLLVVRYQRPIFSFLKKFNLSEQRVDELAQEAFLKAYQNLQMFNKEKGTFTSWLFTIARNLALNEKKKREETYMDESAIDAILADERVNESPEVLITQKSTTTMVNRMIGLLPNPFKTAVILSYIEELSLQDIAHIEQCEVGTIKSRIHRGKNILRKMLLAEGQYGY